MSSLVSRYNIVFGGAIFMERANISKRIASILIDALLMYLLFFICFHGKLKSNYGGLFTFSIIYQLFCYTFFRRTIGDMFLGLKMIFKKSVFFNILLIILHSFAKSVIIVPIGCPGSGISWAIQFVVISAVFQTIPKLKKQLLWDLYNITIIDESLPKNDSVNISGESDPKKKIRNGAIFALINYVYQIVMLIVVVFSVGFGICSSSATIKDTTISFWVIAIVLLFIISILFKLGITKKYEVLRDKLLKVSIMLSGIPSVLGFVLFICNSNKSDFYALFAISSLYLVLSVIFFNVVRRKNF